MFTRWRPVPSARTVRLLYQLGYITSGTACGLATLCLEEQRRRIQVLQKVADNAKVIRQHPKYRGNHALALQTEDDSLAYGLAGGWTPEKMKTRRTSRSEELDDYVDTNDGAIESHLLPSVIGREHSRFYHGRCGTSSAHASSTKHVGPSLRKFDRASRGRKQHPIAVPRFTGSHTEGRDKQSKLALDSLDEGQNRSRSAFKSTSHGDYEGNNRLTSTTSANPRSSVDDRTAMSPEIAPNSKIRSPDIGQNVPLTTLGSSHDAVVGESDNDISFIQALKNGTQDEVSAICQQKFSNNHFTKADEIALCDLLSRRIDDFTLLGVLESFLELTKSAAFNETGHRQRTELVFRFLATSSSLCPRGETKAILLRQSILKTGLAVVQDKIVVEVLEEVCKKYISAGAASTAAGLLMDVANGRGHELPPDDLASEIIEVAIAKSHLTSCGALLRWRAVRKRDVLNLVSPQIDRFIQACAASEDGIFLIKTTFCRKDPIGLFKRGKSLDVLSEESRKYLCVALGTDCALHAKFETCFRSLSKEARLSVAEISSISALRTTWKTTHSAEIVDAQLRSSTKRFEDLFDETALLKLNETALEIYVQGDRMDRALATIRQMHGRNEVSSVVMCQTMLMFAKQRKWDLVDRLFEMLKKFRSFGDDQDARRVFNEVIRIYCRTHEAESVWKFVITAIEDLAFTPNSSTAGTVLGSFVSKRRLDLIPQWYELLHRLGIGFAVDAKLAVALLRRYYIANRPSHVVMTWLCRRLLVYLPNFASPSLVELVEQAVAYDLRNLSGQHARVQRIHAYKRLRRLEGSLGFIPSPGFVWNHDLYFHDSMYSSADQRGTNVDLSDQGSSKQLEGKMWLHISKGEHQKAVDLYQESLDAASIPASPQILELAIEASLRHHNGNRTEADALLSRAQHAGMNTTCASGPLIIHELKQVHADEQLNVIRLRKAVMAYYQANDENGWQPRHYPALKLTTSLIAHGHVNEALELLSTIHASSWAKERTLDITAMTLFLRGYVAIQSLAGIRWVIYTILDKNIRISKQFLKQLRFLTRGNYKWMDKVPSEAHSLLTSWASSCKERHHKQIEEASKLGWELVRTIVKCSASAPDIDAKADDYLEHKIAPGTQLILGSGEFIDESYYSDESSQESDADPTPDLGQRMATDWKAEKLFRLRLKEEALARGTRDRSSSLMSSQLSGEDFVASSDEDDLTMPTVSPSTEKELSSFKPLV